MVYVDVQPRHTSVRVNLAKPSTCDIYFQVINMTPFEIELDRAQIKFWCAGVGIKIQHINKSRFISGQSSSFCVNTEISEPNAENIAKLISENSSSITIDCEFNCDLHDFSKLNHVLDRVRVEFINSHSRQST